MIDRYLEDLESRIDPNVEAELAARWMDFADGEFSGPFFAPRRTKQSPPRIDWPHVTVNEAFHDFDKMLIQQFGRCSTWLSGEAGSLLCVRANYGTSILASLFGAELFMMADEIDTLPTSWPLAGGADAVKRLVDAGAPDIHGGLGAKVFEMGRRFVAVRDKYPKIGRHVHIYHPDLQGPMDICEVLWGSGIFYELVDRPDLVKALLELVTETYIAFMKEWDSIIGFSNHHAVHWEMLHGGHIMLRDDSAMNLSPAMYDEFVKPYDQRLFDVLGGGAVHFCGRGDHYIESLGRTRGLSAVNLSQPHLNDMEKIFRNTVDRGIPILALPREAVDAALAAGRNLHGLVHSAE